MGREKARRRVEKERKCTTLSKVGILKKSGKIILTADGREIGQKSLIEGLGQALSDHWGIRDGRKGEGRRVRGG